MKLERNHAPWIGPLAAGLLALAGLSAMVAAGAPGSTVPQDKNRFIGADKCKSCHSSAEAGDQYHAWLNADHGKAFETLAGDKAKAIATERKLGNPQEAPECLKCHVTAFGAPKEAIKGKLKPEMGVQCESCHGPGDQHLKARFAAAASGKAAEGYTKIPEGEILSDVPASTCLQCHNKESPTFERFCYYEFKAKIRHLNPLKPRTQEELDAMLVCGCEDCKCVDGCDESVCPIPAKDAKK